jgi:hypothetical protein
MLAWPKAAFTTDRGQFNRENVCARLGLALRVVEC